MKRKQFFLSIFAIFITNIAIAQLVKPVAMVRAEGVWHVFDSEGREMWEAHGATFQAPRGYLDGYFCAMQLSGVKNIENVELIYATVLMNHKGEVVFEPKFDFRTNILTPPDVFGLMLMENYETGERFISDMKSTRRSPMCELIVYLGNGLVAYVPKKEGQTEEEAAAENMRTFVIEDLQQNRKLGSFEATTVAEMSEGMIRFFNAENLCGFVNTGGKVIIPPLYSEQNFDNAEQIPKFLNGICYLSNADSVFCYQNKGALLWSLPKEMVASMGENHVRILPEEGGTMVMDKTGNIIKPEIAFDEVTDVNNEGLFGYRKDMETGIMNVNGTVLFRSNDYAAIAVSETHVLLTDTSGNIDFFDKNGFKNRTLKARNVTQKGYGKIEMEDENGKLGIFHADGRPILPFGLEGELVLADGYILHVVSADGKSKHIFYNDNGRMILDDPMTKLNGDWIITIEKRPVFFPY
ncbi:MAG: hypothetical protein RL757_3042 [Bacteroidota bacterium]